MPKIWHAFISQPALPPSLFGGGRQLMPAGYAQVMKSLDWGAGSTFSLLTRQHTARVVGAVPAGWRGAIAGVLEKCLVALGARSERLLAVLGPCTAQASDKVGRELRAQFPAARPDNARFFVASKQAGHARFDLPAYVSDCLRRAGVGAVATLGCDLRCKPVGGHHAGR